MARRRPSALLCFPLVASGGLHRQHPDKKAADSERPADVTPSCGPSSPCKSSTLLEDLAHKHFIDKGRDGHGYVQLYAMLFDPLRHDVRNFTEVGVQFGRALPVWHEYFPRAQLWVMDTAPKPDAWAQAKKLGERVHLLSPANSQLESTPARFGLSPGSMDIVLDDGDHSPLGNARTLLALWPLVRPGGYYIMEDVDTGGNSHGHHISRGSHNTKWYPPGYAWIAHAGSSNGTLKLDLADRQRRAAGINHRWPEEVQAIYEQNDVFFADTLVGHRDFTGLQRDLGGWMKDRVSHNSHCLVIRRRDPPRSRPVRLVAGSG